MIRFLSFFALVIGSMVVIQPAAAGALPGLLAKINLGPVAGQRRQIPEVPAGCQSTCDPINTILTTGNCPPTECCLAAFETSYFNCFICVATAVNVTDYSDPQSLIDTLYDECARLGFQLPVLTFPGQSPNRALSSVVLPSSSQTTLVSVVSSTRSSARVTITALTTTAASTTNPTTSAQTSTTNTASPTSSVSSGIRSAVTGWFYLITSAMMLGTWFYFAV